MSLQDQLSHQKPSSRLTEEIFDTGEGRSIEGRLTFYDHSELDSRLVKSVADLPESHPAEKSWLHWEGLEPEQRLLDILEKSAVHPLIAEDILNVNGRIKFEQLEDCLIIILKLPVSSKERLTMRTLHFCLILRPDSVLSFSERPLPFLGSIEERLQDASRRIRRLGSAYLGWAILDVIVDYIFHFVEEVEAEVAGIESKLIEGTAKIELAEIYDYRTQATALLRILRPLRDVTNHLAVRENSLIEREISLFYGDLHDHTEQALEIANHLRDQADSLRELYFTATSHRMNEVMKVLTSLSAIFLPLTFLTGLYGMNFVWIPELQYPAGYPILLGVLGLISVSLIVYFKRRNWL